MSIFICERCGRLDNSANKNNFWHSQSNKSKISDGSFIYVAYKPKFSYFETHSCCALCCKGLRFKDGSGSYTGDECGTVSKEKYTEFQKKN